MLSDLYRTRMLQYLKICQLHLRHMKTLHPIFHHHPIPLLLVPAPLSAVRLYIQACRPSIGRANLRVVITDLILLLVLEALGLVTGPQYQTGPLNQPTSTFRLDAEFQGYIVYIFFGGGDKMEYMYSCILNRSIQIFDTFPSPHFLG